MEGTQGNPSGNPTASPTKLKPGLKRPLPRPGPLAAALGATTADHHDLHLGFGGLNGNGDPFSPRKRLKRTPPKGTPPAIAGHEPLSGAATGPRVLNLGAMESASAAGQKQQQGQDQDQDQQDQQQDSTPASTPPSSPSRHPSPTRAAPPRHPPTASKPLAPATSSAAPLRPSFRQPLLHRTPAPAGKPSTTTSTPSHPHPTPARAPPATPLTAKPPPAAHTSRHAFTPLLGFPGTPIAIAGLHTVDGGRGAATGAGSTVKGQTTLSFTPRRQPPPPAPKSRLLAPRRMTVAFSAATTTRVGAAQAQPARPAAAAAAAAPAPAPKQAEIGIHRHLRLESMPGGKSQFVDCGPVTKPTSFAHKGENRGDWECVPDYVLDFGRSVVFGEFEGCTW